MEYTLTSLINVLLALRTVQDKNSGSSMPASAIFIEQNLFAVEIIILRRP
jgi:hypothetical protein